MKLLSGHKSTIFILSLGLLMACTGKEKIKENQIKFETVKLDTMVNLFNDSTKPKCDFSLEMVYPSAGESQEKLTKLQELFVADYFGDKYIGQIPTIAANSYMKDYVENYLLLEEDYKKFKSEDNDNMVGAWMNYVEKSSSSIYFNAGNIISYTINFYTYTGGAHGMQANTNFVIDAKNNTPITLVDIFSESNFEEVAKIIISTIAADRGYTDPKQLNEEGFFSLEEVSPTDNFLVNEKGMKWTYNPYEIAVYAAGTIEVFVEWDKLIPYIIEESPVLPIINSQPIAN
ncbi:MAG: DUF3298 domain-containing protein [Bacteroidales bacterium]|nr:DUF3298 domain-containing protein [Bacteroidales bacterium]